MTKAVKVEPTAAADHVRALSVHLADTGHRPHRLARIIPATVEHASV